MCVCERERERESKISPLFTADIMLNSNVCADQIWWNLIGKGNLIFQSSNSLYRCLKYVGILCQSQFNSMYERNIEICYNNYIF